MSDENDSYTEVTSTSWFSRLGDSFKGIGTGFLLIIAATALLWWNEGRTVRTGDAIVEAQLATEPMPAITKVDSAFEGKMVYATGRAVTKDELTDPVFGVKVNAIKLRRKVEYYQWVEHRRSEKRQKLGGGEETVTTYTYSREWVNHPVDSQSFKQMVGHENKTRIQTEAADWLAPNVTFGAYRFPAFLARSIGGEKPLDISLTDTQRAELQKAFFAPNASLDASQVVGQQGASMIHTQTNTIYVGREPGAPSIGDVRVTFFETPAAEVSILAKVNGDTFVPFRASNGNTFSRLSMGIQDMNSMFDAAKSGNATMAWILRGLGLVLCVTGFGMVFAPLKVLADVIPLLGSIVGAGTGLVAGLLGTAWSMVIIAIAWIRFRPVLGAWRGARPGDPAVRQGTHEEVRPHRPGPRSLGTGSALLTESPPQPQGARHEEAHPGTLCPARLLCDGMGNGAQVGQVLRVLHRQRQA